ncbi:MAG: peptidyl-prolyl cis-trans isomerase [Vicinamibacterales bacterium]
MTMLDQMRRHKGWLKWSLALVVLTFVVFYIPDFLTTATGAAPGSVVAEVEGQSITVGAFQRRYQAQLQAYRQAYGSQLSEDLLRQLGIQQQILQQLVDEEAMVAEARRQGIDVSDVEVRQRILSMPAFQENGQFIGEQRYRQVLQFQNPPLTTADFENNLRRAIAVDKLQSAVTGWMSVSDSEVDQEYRRRNEKVKLDVVPVSPDAFRSDVTVTDADLKTYFDAHKETYRVGEKRKVKYLLVDVDAVRATTTVPEADIEKFYQDNLQQYQTPEQVRASHILLRTEGKDEEAVKAQAQSLADQARAGADFAALAKQYSEDESNKDLGGDLDYFGRGRMVPEFEQAAFGLEVGQISDPVKSPFGYHVIKVTDKKPAETRPLADVRPEIEDQLKWQRAQELAEQTAKVIEASVKTAADLDTVAAERSLPITETGPLLQSDPIDGLGPAPEVSAQVFQLADGAVTPALRVARGWAIATVTGKEPSHLPEFAEVESRVREDLVTERAGELAKERAGGIADSLKAASDFAAAAKRAGLEVQTTELVARGSALPTVGVSPAVDDAAFALAAGQVSAPITTPQGTVIVRVVERSEVTDAEVAAGRDQLRQEMVGERRSRFFSAYMTKAKGQLKIEMYPDVLARIAS